MPKNPPDNMPRITPAVFYDDPQAALDWLAKAFGFKTRLAVPGPDGGIVHSEMEFADGVIMVGPSGAREGLCRSPQAAGGANTQTLYVYVDDVDAHCQRAREAGTQITAEPETKFYGDRVYEALDPEGHRWSFGQHVRDVGLENMSPER